MARTRKELVAQYLRLFLLIVDSLTAVRELTLGNRGVAWCQLSDPPVVLPVLG